MTETIMACKILMKKPRCEEHLKTEPISIDFGVK